jgi:hypothetical protein
MVTSILSDMKVTWCQLWSWSSFLCEEECTTKCIIKWLEGKSYMESGLPDVKPFVMDHALLRSYAQMQSLAEMPVSVL